MAARVNNPAYKVLVENDLLCTKYLVDGFHSLQLRPSKSGPWKNVLSMLLLGSCRGKKYFTVQDGCVRFGEDGDGNFHVFGPGVHKIQDFFLSVEKRDVS